MGCSCLFRRAVPDWPFYPVPLDGVVDVRCRRRLPVRSRSPGDEDGAHQGIVSLKCFLKMSFATRRLAFKPNPRSLCYRVNICVHFNTDLRPLKRNVAGKRQLEAGWIRTWTTGHHTGLFKALLVQASTVSSQIEALERIISFLSEMSSTKMLDCRDAPQKNIKHIFVEHGFSDSLHFHV